MNCQPHRADCGCVSRGGRNEAVMRELVIAPVADRGRPDFSAAA